MRSVLANGRFFSAMRSRCGRFASSKELINKSHGMFAKWKYIPEKVVPSHKNSGDFSS